MSLGKQMIQIEVEDEDEEMLPEAKMQKVVKMMIMSTCTHQNSLMMKIKKKKMSLTKSNFSN